MSDRSWSEVPDSDPGGERTLRLLCLGSGKASVLSLVGLSEGIGILTGTYHRLRVLIQGHESWEFGVGSRCKEIPLRLDVTCQAEEGVQV